jgi:hypothetical protein
MSQAVVSDGESSATPAIDWALRLALTLTAFWLGLGLLYIGDLIGWTRFATQPVADLGQFLEGAFAPLAFLWLVIGQFQQQRELAANNEAIRLQYQIMRKTAEHAEVQARAVSANELHARQDTFIELAAMVTRQCSSALGLLYGSSQGPAGNGKVSSEQFAELWKTHGSGDPEVFARAMFVLALQLPPGASSYDLFYGTPVRTRHTENVYRAYGRLLRNAAACDPDGMITDALLGSALGRIYQIAERHREQWLAAGSPNAPA